MPEVTAPAEEPSTIPLIDRWRPARAGIRNIWEYDDQEFAFADGRLILRGPNGSGKSNALALLFPFLLDATMSAARMDPFAGGGRSMKTLLLGARHDDDPAGRRFRHDQRTGYVWLELVRHGPSGDDEHLVIGCGARATVQRDASAWYFVTGRRPGVDLDLAPDGTPLSHTRLAEELGAGAVFETAEAYRGAVDQHLFGVGPDRYRNLVELVLVLRRPQLAGRLDLDKLSGVLSEGLPGLPETLVDDVAASFDDLEAVQDDLRRLREARTVVDAFLPGYRDYLRTVAARRAAAVLGAGRDRRRAERAVAQAEAEGERLDEVVAAARAAGEANDVARAEAEQRRIAVVESPAYRDARELVELTERVAQAARDLDAARRRHQEAAETLSRVTTELADGERLVAAADAELAVATRSAMETGDAAGVAWRLVGPVDAGAETRAELAAAATERREEIRGVRAAATAHRDAHRDATRDADTSSASAAAADVGEGDRDRAAAALDATRELLALSLEAWVQGPGAGWLAAADGEALGAAVERLGEPGEGTLRDVLAGLLAPSRERLVEARTKARAQRDDRVAERATVTAERDRVAAEADDAPAARPTRPADRTGRPGAPFYACCDFEPGVAEDERAGIEAALDAAGLLDAWLAPDGRDADALDAWLDPSGPAVDGPCLAEVLIATPPPGSGLDRAAVDRVLAAVGLGRAGVAVDAEGHYALGPLVGRHRVERAGFIGATARADRRQRRLAELEDRRRVLADEVAAAEERAAEADEHLATLAGLAGELPPTTEVTDAVTAHQRAAAEATLLRERAETAEEQARRSRQAASQLQSALQEAAAAHRLPEDLAGLETAVEAVRVFDGTVDRLLSAAERRDDRHEEEGRVRTRHGAAQVAVAQRDQEAVDAEVARAGLAARLATLRGRLEPGAESLVDELARLEGELAERRDEARSLAEAEREAAAARGGARASADGARAEVDRRHDEQAVVAAQMAVLGHPHVWAIVIGDGGAVAPEGPDAPPADPEARASAIAEATSGQEATEEAEHDANRRLMTAFRGLLDQLRHGFDPSLDTPDGVSVVEVTSEAGTFSVLHLARELADQQARQESLLSERDREIFERHLLSRVAESLRGLLNDAEHFVDEVNQCLRRTPTASGLRVELRWELDSEDRATKAAVRLLHRSPDLLGPDERDRLRAFFTGAIDQQRAEDPGAGYATVLRRALDHRGWHVFRPHLVTAEGTTQRLTRQVFKQLSGGEQAVTLHLPLFAAAAAHYNEAAPHAPRLVALDEAFAGIDEGMRGELMGLLVQFDLDVVMTGHELWGAYEEVPAVAVYDLLRRPPAEGVSALMLRWDGAVLTEA